VGHPARVAYTPYSLHTQVNPPARLKWLYWYDLAGQGQPVQTAWGWGGSKYAFYSIEDLHNMIYLIPTAVQDFGLDWFCGFFGKAEVKLMIQAALNSSQTLGCIVKLQVIVALIIQFYLCSQPSSLAASAKEFCNWNWVHLFFYFFVHVCITNHIFSTSNTSGVSKSHIWSFSFIFTLQNGRYFSVSWWLPASQCLQ